MTNDHVRTLLQNCLEFGVTNVSVDLSVGGADVPESVVSENGKPVTFALSWTFTGTNLTINEDTVEADLSFKGSRHHCVLPYRAIRAMQSPRLVILVKEEGYVEWKMNTQGIVEAHARLPEQLELRPLKPKRTGFRVIKGGLDDQE